MVQGQELLHELWQKQSSEQSPLLKPSGTQAFVPILGALVH